MNKIDHGNKNKERVDKIKIKRNTLSGSELGSQMWDNESHLKTLFVFLPRPGGLICETKVFCFFLFPFGSCVSLSQGQCHPM